MDFEELQSSVMDLVNTFTDQMHKIKAKDLGLDERCGWLHVTKDCIAVEKHRNGTLQYYGGFEYVKKEYQIEMGEWVFYSSEDGRVFNHLDRVAELFNEEEEND